MPERGEISPSTIGEETIQTVNARELHEKLKSGRQFANWIQDKLEDGPWKEGRDYVLTINKVGIRSNVTQKDYHISIEMAKHIAMMERSEPGYVVRDYFIQCEKKAQAAAIPMDPLDSIRNNPQKALAVSTITTHKRPIHLVFVQTNYTFFTLKPTNSLILKKAWCPIAESSNPLFLLIFLLTLHQDLSIIEQ